MRGLIAAGMMMVASAAGAQNFGLTVEAVTPAFKNLQPPLALVECNERRCVFQNEDKDLAAFMTFGDRKVVEGFYVLYRNSNWAQAAKTVADIQRILLVPEKNIAHVESLAEHGLNGVTNDVATPFISCSSKPSSEDPVIACNRR
jgi:hypothetical protein